MICFENETRLKPGDRVVLIREQRWPGVARAKGLRHKKGDNVDLVPMGATGTLAVQDGMWVVRFAQFPADPEWPCLIGTHPAKLPDWIQPVAEVPTSEVADDALLRATAHL